METGCGIARTLIGPWVLNYGFRALSKSVEITPTGQPPPTCLVQHDGDLDRLPAIAFDRKNCLKCIKCVKCLSFLFVFIYNAVPITTREAMTSEAFHSASSDWIFLLVGFC